MSRERDNYNQKLASLKDLIISYGDMVLALSGGKDSTLLLAIGIKVLDANKFAALTAVSPIKKRGRKGTSREFMLQTRGIPPNCPYRSHKNPEFIKKPERRCFICKEKIYRSLRHVALELGLRNDPKGTNYDYIKKERRVDEIGRMYIVKRPLV